MGVYGGDHNFSMLRYTGPCIWIGSVEQPKEQEKDNEDEMRNTCTILVGNLKGRDHLEG
jgi:hypothetical protein